MRLTKIVVSITLVCFGYIAQKQLIQARSHSLVPNDPLAENIHNEQRQTVQPIVTNGDPIIVAVGDIACDPNSPNYNNGNGDRDHCHMKATSNLLVDTKLTAVLPLGDNQYQSGELSAFQESYEPTWGRFKSISHPVVGNHEYYNDENASGYFQYFKSVAGEVEKGYYSYDLGNWHLIALNSNCPQVGGCHVGSPQEKWLKADLDAHKNKCTLAYWHHPRFSSGKHGNDNNYDAFWRVLYQAGVEIVLNGHEHSYERFAPQSPEGKLEPNLGIRQFVVGTGGKDHYKFKDIQPNSIVRNADTYGVLQLTLHTDNYSWQFIPEVGKTFTDVGSYPCH